MLYFYIVGLLNIKMVQQNEQLVFIRVSSPNKSCICFFEDFSDLLRLDTHFGLVSLSYNIR